MSVCDVTSHIAKMLAFKHFLAVVLRSVILTFAGTGVAYTHPIFDVKIHNQLVGIISGSWHSAGNQFSSKIYSNIDSAINLADVVYMEYGEPPPTVPIIIETFGVKSDFRMRSMITKFSPLCLSELSLQLNRGGAFSSYLLDLPPYAFFLRWFAPITIPSRKGAVNAISLDDYHNYRSLMRGIKVVSMEKLAESADYLREFDNEEVFWLAESACLKLSQPGYLAGKRNFDEFDSLLNAFEAGNVDESRRLAINAFYAAGWEEKLIFAFIQKRDKRFAKYIDQKISQSNGRRPLFVVGVSHLGGEDGILSLLKKAGYVITPRQF